MRKSGGGGRGNSGGDRPSRKLRLEGQKILSSSDFTPGYPKEMSVDVHSCAYT